MGWTKRELVDEAFAELALAGYVFDLSPEELASAERRMDAMLAKWGADGLRLGYLMSDRPDLTNPTAQAGIPDHAAEAVYTNLAVRIAQMLGKTVPVATAALAKSAYAQLMRSAAMPTQQQFPDTLPKGAGAKTWRLSKQPFIIGPDDSPIIDGQGNNLDILAE